jgi:hypothetical protein
MANPVAALLIGRTMVAQVESGRATRDERRGTRAEARRRRTHPRPMTIPRIAPARSARARRIARADS